MWVQVTCLVLALAAQSAVVALQQPVVVVAGATGRTGRLVVEKLLQRNTTTTVRAFCRDPSKAKEVLPNHPNLELVVGDLDSARDIRKACDGADGAIWCATGFSDAASPLNRLKGLLGLTVFYQDSIDIKGLGTVATALKSSSDAVERAPKVVMLSSAGVTRPGWDEAKQAKLDGAADIPIVRLNPFGILGKKCEAEENLRQSGVPYAILRPCGLNDDWPPGRPIFSQGDVAVGRTSRDDVATVLVAMLDEPTAQGKTMEMLSLRGYPKPRSFGKAFEQLRADAEAVDEQMVQAQYALLQQLLPGEVQDPTQLEMGRTYEQLDQNEIAPREKKAEATQREKDLAASVKG